MPRRSPERDKAFFDALRLGATVDAAAAAARYSDNTVYERRRKEPDFAKAWQDAIAECDRRAYEQHTASLRAGDDRGRRGTCLTRRRAPGVVGAAPSLDVPASPVWAPQPGPQTELIGCPVFEVFFGGARGGGKTDGMLGEFMAHAQQYGRDAIGLMVRRRRTELVDTVERSRQIFSPLRWTFHEEKKM